MRVNSLKEKADACNAFIEDVMNWWIIKRNKAIRPAGWRVMFSGTTHENLSFGARVEMYGLGKIFKRLVFTSNKYDITELPESMIHEVMDAIFHPAGQDVCTPKDLTTSTGNVIHYEARWQPPDDYIMQLRTKRIMTDKIMTAAEWEIWEHVFAKKYDELGGKPPSFIKGATIIQVPGTRH